MMHAVVGVLGRCVAASDWSFAAASVEPTHTHMLITYTPRDIDRALKWLKDQTTKAVHRNTPHRGPVWCKGRWRSFIFDDAAWQAAIRYIGSHNRRRGLAARPYPFLRPPPTDP